MDNRTRGALEHQLGVALKLQRRHAQALQHMDSAQALLGGRSRDRDLDRANLLQHLLRFEEAAGIYKALLADKPQDMQTHVLLNEIYYRQRRDDEFLRSYDDALEKDPTAALLPAAKGHFLLKLGRVAEAEQAFRKALHIAPQEAAAQSGLARALDALDDFPAANAAHRLAVSSHPDNGDMLEEYAGFLLRREDCRFAQQIAEQAHRLRPDSQGALAVMGLCYRANGDKRDEHLNDYENFVQIFDLDPPAGYSDMQDFNRDLASYLDELHCDVREYFTQTLRGGTRLYDEVFFNGHDLVDRLVPVIHDAIGRYCASLTGAAGHPLVSRRGSGFRYSGSWSSRLADCGFHVNHVHQKGWISSCYYVAVPEVVADSGARQGWIKFGEPSGDFGTAFPPMRSVQPRPGRLVLFPSYLWHGTVPFHSPQSRTTIAFDVVPD